MEEDLSGQILIDKYRLIERLGIGGAACVYLAQHVGTGRKVAVKVLHSSLVTNDDIVQRFEHEARAAVAVEHENVVDIFDVGRTAWGAPFLVMELLRGESLADLLYRAAPLELPIACKILEPVLLGLAAAHEKGFVHRDLKPENIFIVRKAETDFTVKLIDFGIAKLPPSMLDTSHTMSGTFWGSPEYASPEQTRGDRDLDQRSDLFSAGVVFYEMLTGGRPFTGELVAETQISIMTQPPRSPWELNPGFPKQALPIIERALKKRPAQRYQTALSMLEDMQPLLRPKKRKKRDTTRRYLFGEHHKLVVLPMETSGARSPAAQGTVGPTSAGEGSEISFAIVPVLPPLPQPVVAVATPPVAAPEARPRPRSTSRAVLFIGVAASVLLLAAAAVVCSLFVVASAPVEAPATVPIEPLIAKAPASLSAPPTAGSLPNLVLPDTPPDTETASAAALATAATKDTAEPQAPPSTEGLRAVPVTADPAYQRLVRPVLAARKKDVWPCYINELAGNSTLRGMLELSLVLNDRGGVIKVLVTKNTVRHPPTIRCVREKAYSFLLPKPSQPGVEVRWTLVFKRPDTLLPKKLDTNPFHR